MAESSLLLESVVGHLILEDATGLILLESSPGANDIPPTLIIRIQPISVMQLRKSS